MKNRESFLLLVGPAVIWLIMAIIIALGASQGLDWKMQDFLTTVRPEPKVDPDILMVDIDDGSIQAKGLWPWPRRILGDVLLRLKEFGAHYMTFDIEYIDVGISGLDLENRKKNSDRILQEMLDLQKGVANGLISKNEAGDYTRLALDEGIRDLIPDNDEYIGKAISVFGNSFVTLNMRVGSENNPIAQEALEYAQERIFLPEVTGNLDSLATAKNLEMRATILNIISRAEGAGFVDMDPDSDGVTRRVHLLWRYKDKVYGQLAFYPLLHKWGNPPLEVYSDKIIVKRSKLANPAPDIVIPRGEDGRTLINWVRGTYDVTFKHVQVSQFFELDRLEKEIADLIIALRDSGVLSLYEGGDFSNMVDELSGMYAEAHETENRELFEEYLALKEQYLVKLTDFVSETSLANINAALEGLVQEQRQSGNELATSELQAVVDNIQQYLGFIKKNFTALSQSRAELSKLIAGSFGIIGNTATSTTDLGVNPYDSQYENPGVHANVANTVISGEFLDDTPNWYGSIIAAMLVLLIAFLLWRIKNTVNSLIVGFATLASSAFGLSMVYYLTGLYLPIIGPLIAMVLTFVYLITLKFILTDKDKRFIRTAFASYLSPDVIKDIEKDPSKLGLGGEKRHMTAMFTDVKGFSTFSEKLASNDLVSLLNAYLTGMGDIILDQRGTIDKYEGDAIIAFWGAPSIQPDHAARAMRSAIWMRRKELEMNVEFLASGLAPSPLFTRIGINTGDMTVGNMGTQNRMNYTAMGNAMNLAARLEGVNKQYGTWILTSETSRDEAGDDFLFRGLDRVRVVGINTPVRLYNVMEEKSQATQAMLEIVGHFEEGIALFEDRQWAKAIAKFNEVLKIDAEDGPAKTFIERCRKFAKAPPPENWDGVFSLTEK